jgi:hypothetical protein
MTDLDRLRNVLARNETQCEDLPADVEVRNEARGHLWYEARFGDLFAMVVRPNPVLAPREVYERKAARWSAGWPELTVLPSR